MNYLNSGLISLGIGTGLFGANHLYGANPVNTATSKKPNVVFILADDLGYGDLSCYGQKKFTTPNIDRLAASGIRFTNHYAGCTVSAPSRSALMTGLHTGHTYIRGNKEMLPEGQEPLPAGTYTIARLFKEAGYATGAFGKWGLGGPGTEGVPEKMGFDEFFGFNCQSLAHNYYPDYLWHNDQKVYLEGNKNRGKGQYAHDEYHKMALQFIDKHKDEPFFLFCPYVIPHAELSAPDDTLFEKFDGTFPEKPFHGVDSGPKYRKGGYGSQPQPNAAFAAMVTRLDRSVGEIVQKIKALGLENNTLIIFTSDNGPHREGGADPDFFKSNGPLRGFKRSLYEGGIRIPMIVSWMEKIVPGRTSEFPSAFWDFMPTFAEILGVKTSQPTDGVSLLPVLTGKGKQLDHPFLYWEFHEGGTKQAIRFGDWKCVRFGIKEPLELFNLKEDLHEDHNVAFKYPEIVKKLEVLLSGARTESVIWKAQELWPAGAKRE